MKKFLFLKCLFILSLVTGCAHSPASHDDPSTHVNPEPLSETAQLREHVSKLSERVQDLEVRIGALNDKINLETEKPKTVIAINSEGATESGAGVDTQVIEAPPAHAKKVPVKHPDENLTESLDRFREAKILYDTEKYSDSLLEFSEFVKNLPENPLAPAAQYFLGMSYFKQKEYKLAEEELSRGLITYLHSDYIPDTLLALSHVSAILKKPTQASYYREKLLNHFPRSPAATSLTETGEIKEKIPEKTRSQEETLQIESPTLPTVVTPSVVNQEKEQ